MRLLSPVLGKPAITLTKGVRYMLISTLSFGIMNVVVKELGDFPVMETVFFRCFTSMILCFAVIYRQHTDWKGSNRILLLARGGFGTLAVYTFFVTLAKMPLGTAVTIQYLSPIFTTVIAIFLLGERVKPLQWLFFILSFSGVLIIKGFDARVSLTMLGIGILSALCSGVAYNLVRSLKGKEDTMVVVLHFQIVGVIIGLAFSIFNWQMPNARQLFLLILTGVCTQVGQVNLTKALQLEKVANVSILNYLGILYALILGFILYKEQYNLLTVLGITFVIGGVLLNLFYQKQTTVLVAEEELSGNIE